jgi:O-antigen/teichoic acid export membrane protein
MYRKARPGIHRKYWRFGLKFSLPIVPHGVSQVLLAQFDRIMIRSLVSDAAAGIYSLAGNIRLILTVITASVTEAWSTWFYGQMGKKEHGCIRTRATQLCGLFTILTVGLMAISPEMVLILGGKAYDSAKYVAIPMILDSYILFIYDVIVTGEYYSKKTVYIMLGTMAAAVLNIVLNYVFILQYGFLAAAYTTLFAYVCYLLLHLVISRRLTGFCILPIRWLLVYSVIACGMAAASLLLVNNLLLRWGLCAVVVVPMGLLLLRNYRKTQV